MKICTLSSSSSGNCTLISQGDTHLLIDAGISLRRVSLHLSAFGITPENLSGVLLTHEHTDHIGGIRMLCKYHNTQLFTSRIVGSCLSAVWPETDGNIVSFDAGDDFEIGELSIRSFATMHDTPESVGYRVSSASGSVFYATDLGIVTDNVKKAAYGAEIAIIEANHDVTMLKNGPYPPHLKQRILSDRGHLSNDCCAAFVSELTKAGTKQIALAHLSKENNTPALAYETVAGVLERGGFKRVSIDVLPHDTPGKVYEI